MPAYFYVVVDGTPTTPEVPLTAEQAAQDFLIEAAEAAGEGWEVGIQPCTREDLEWAGVST